MKTGFFRSFRPSSFSLWAQGGVVCGVAAVLSACAPEFDTSHTSSKRASLGYEVFTALCDRVGAGELREDLTGASFRGVCHDDGAGYADAVDDSKLPALLGDEVDQDGNTVTLEQQRQERERRMRRVEIFGAKRDDIANAIDAIIPDADILVRTLTVDEKGRSVPPESSCNIASEPGSLHTELSTLLGNFGKLYADDTIPAVTQALARTLAVFRDSEEPRAAWGRLSAREGYRPPAVGLGMMRPAAAYPEIRELLSTLISQISSDSRPYEEINGVHVATPGPAYGKFVHLLQVAQREFENATADPLAAPLRSVINEPSELSVLSRPRENLELLSALMLAEDDEFGSGPQRYLVRRDSRGIAELASLRAPFVDADEDGLPDVDSFGRFITSGGQAPTPFRVPTGTGGARDNFGRALIDNELAYNYVDTSRTFVASVLRDSVGLFNVDPQSGRETMMDALAGVYVIAGGRSAERSANKRYADGSNLSYAAFDTERSPLLDLVHALTQLVAEPAIDDALLVAKKLAVSHEAELARVLKAVLEARNLSEQHPEAKLAPQATLWDDLFELLSGMAAEPGLFESMLEAITDDDTLLLGELLGKWAVYRDEYVYDRNAINSPPLNKQTGARLGEPVQLIDPNAADSGDNRSMLQRFLQLMSDGRGVATCNRPNAQVKARAFGVNVTVPLGDTTFAECGVYKVDDLDVLLLQAMVGSPKAQLFLRDSSLRNGLFAGLGRATVGLMEDSSDLTGFFTPRDSTVLRPRAEWLARKVFFDFQGDTGSRNQRTRDFIEALDGMNTGSSVCPERVIDDPCRNGGCDFGGAVPMPSDVAADGKIRGLRSCQPGDWLAQRNPNTLFMMEALNGYRAFTPLAKAFVDHDREDLFIDLSVALHKHWQTGEGTAAECRTNRGPCAKTGTSTYQPLLGEILVRDTLPALSTLLKAARALRINHCTSVDAQGRCTASELRTGIQVLAEAQRVAFSTSHATRVDLRDRRGRSGTQKNDGSPVDRVTPAYLLTDALNAIDTAYEQFDGGSGKGAARQAQFRRARSQLADHFLGIAGEGEQARFARRGVIKVLPILVDLVRSQTWANCPTSFGDNPARCEWARQELVAKLEETLGGPMFAASLELLDTLRQDPRTRSELQRVLLYMLDAASANEALPSTLASANDLFQKLGDDQNLVPFFKVLAAAMATEDAKGASQKSLVDATLTMLGKIAGRYEDVVDDEIVELCVYEVDPNQVLNALLATAVTPSESIGGRAPIEVLLDVIADVNRVAPEEPKTVYDSDDYEAISASVVDFLISKERGMEQFYEIVRRGQNKP